MTLLSFVALAASIVWVCFFTSWYEQRKQGKTVSNVVEVNNNNINRPEWHPSSSRRSVTKKTKSESWFGLFCLKILVFICLMVVMFSVCSSIYAFLAIPGMTVVVLGVVMVLRRISS
jgi:Flp pilus assembly protein TadB